MSRFPFPVPFGWFGIGFPDEYPAGTPRPAYFFDRHLVVWRDARDALHVNDAFCPHLGAHLGHGGTVEDCELVCPFHGWKFDTDGVNTDIPYSERVNKKGRLRSYPVVERNGFCMVWYHPDPDVGPQWEVPEITEFGDDPDWSTDMRTQYEVGSTIQELAENGVDSAHFRFVHNTASVPELESYETGFPESRMRSSQKFPTPRGIMEGRIDTTSYGPGLSVVSFAGIVDTLNMAVQTPIDGETTKVWFNFRFKTMGDLETTRNVGEAFVREVDKQVQEDIPIWEHKAHLVRPALADNDGPFMKFRKWYAQFYATDVDGEHDQYDPPWDPSRVDEAPQKATASFRHHEVP